jgi:hypothetical protein
MKMNSLAFGLLKRGGIPEGYNDCMKLVERFKVKAKSGGKQF